MSQLSQHVFEAFLKPCLAVFGDPPTEDATLFLTEYDRQLSSFSVEALAKAKDAVVRSHKGPARWPKVAACVDAAVDAQDSIAQRTKSRERSDLEVYYFRYKKAEERLDCELGRRAAREGWCLGLKEFVAETNRMPTPSEISAIQSTSKYVDRCAAGAVQMGHFHKELQALGSSMIRRREDLATRLVGEPSISELTRRITGERND